MIKEKHRLTGNLNAKQSLSSKLGNAIIYIDPLTQEKSVEPSKLKQVIMPDNGFNGLSKVTVNKIADSYIIPSGEIEIKENGSYDITDKKLAIVNVPASGGDISEYFQNIRPGEATGYGKFSPFTEGLIKIPDGLIYNINKFKYDFSNISYFFYGHRNLTDITNALPIISELVSDENVTRAEDMFGYCTGLTEIPLFDTSNITTMVGMFRGCRNLTSIPLFNTQNVTRMDYMFYNNDKLQTIPSLNTSKVTNFTNMFQGCYALTTLPLLDFSSALSIYGLFTGVISLTNLGGFQNLGQAYYTTTTANNNNYTLNLYTSTQDKNLLTEQSMINVLNNLYDIATKGCKTQTVRFGTKNLAKLTSTAGQTALSNAQAKGWTVS